MSFDSSARNALLSFLPEAQLITARNTEALSYKYKAQLGLRSPRILSILDPACWGRVEPDDSLDYGGYKYFDGLDLECDGKSPVTAVDESSGATIRKGESDIVLIHVSNIVGPGHFRRQLGSAARYINAQDRLSSRRFIGGVTYSEMGRLVVRMGLRNMDILEIDERYKLHLMADYMVYCAINHKNDKELQPFAAFLPTKEFIDTFSSVD